MTGNVNKKTGKKKRERGEIKEVRKETQREGRRGGATMGNSNYPNF